MFVAWNGDADDGLAIVTLVDIPANTILYFNDNEWNGLPIGGGGAFNNLTEFEMTWNTGPAIIPAGTIVDFNELDNTGNPGYGTTVGTLTDNLQVNASNEVIYIFEGSNNSTPTTFITAMANDGFTAGNGTLAGTGLTQGLDALAITGDEDLMEYRGILCDNANNLRSALADPSNWITEDGAGDQSNNGAPDFPHSVGFFTVGCSTYTPVATGPACGAINISDASAFLLFDTTASLWFRADSGTNCITDGCLVSQWDDKGVSGINVTQANAALQPSLELNTINFNPTLAFNGINNGQILNGTGLAQNENATLIVVGLEQTQATAAGGSSFRPLFSAAGNYDGTNIFGYEINSSANNLVDRTTYLGPSNTNIALTSVFDVGVFNNVYNIYTTSNDNNNLSAFKNGDLRGTATPSRTAGFTTDFSIGGNTGLNVRRYRGNIAEVIFCSRPLTVIYRQQTETYLAIKYGITLTNNYLSFNDTNIIYDVSNGYANGVFGIGRNNAYGLYQPKSKSESDFSGVTIEATINIGDENYLVTGHDNGSLARITVAGQTNVLTRKWFAQMTGGVGTVSVELDLAAIGANTTPAPSNVKIGISNTPGLAFTKWINATSVVGGVATFTGIDLYDKYYTFSAAP